jgi:hypothetical protein
VIVVKFQAAESLGDIKEALKFINSDKFFSGNETVYHSQKEWEDWVLFTNAVGENKKFTNVFKYYDYDITEQTSGAKSFLCFNSLEQKAKVKTIKYKLELCDQNWKIVGLSYVLSQ